MKTRENTTQHYVIYKCPTCKKSFRQTFSVVHRAVDNEHPEWYLRKTKHYFSVNGGTFVHSESLYYPTLKCECSSIRLLYGRRIDGRVVDTCPCDRRCTHAKGHSCECSCGGANHGSAWDI